MDRVRKLAMTLLILCVSLCACAKPKPSPNEKNSLSEMETTISEEMAVSSETSSFETTSMGDSEEQMKAGWRKIEIAPSVGSYVTISFQIPEDWECFCVQSEDVPVSDIGVSIYPKSVGDTNGAISINSLRGFGICGTGLRFEEMTFNGLPARKATFGQNTYWSYIFLDPPYQDCSIQNNAGESWYFEYQDEIDEILSTVEFTLVDIDSGDQSDDG